ncbi:MarR family winged helix-turn-helix transcriptional regulator [Bacteroidota bacterium]
MKIKDAIKQKSFESSMQKAVINLEYTSNWFRDSQNQSFKPYGILPQHFNVLKILKGKHPALVSPSYIKEVMLDKSPDLTRLVDKLVQKGWASRQQCEQNRRMVEIGLTAKGIKILETISQQVKDTSVNLENRLTDKEANQLSNLLDKLRD